MSTQSRIIPITKKIKVVSKNRIEYNDIQKFVYPFNAVLTLVFCSKYSICKDNITPRGIKYCIYIFLGIFSAITVTSIRMSLMIAYYYKTNETQDPLIIFLTIYLPGLNLASFITACITNITNGKRNVLLIKMIQNINADVAFGEIRSFIIWSWVSLMMVICVETAVYISGSSYLGFISILGGYSEIIFSMIDVDFVYTIRLQLLLTKYLEKWILKVQFATFEGVNEDSYFKKIFETYTNILKAYDLFNTVSKSLVSLIKKIIIKTIRIMFRVINAFCRNLGDFQLMLCFVTKWNNVVFRTNFMAVVVVILAIAKMTLIIMVHSRYSEKFNMTVEDASLACIVRMKNPYCSKVEKQFCKNILRENATFSKMTACGLFYIDGRLPLSLLGFLTQYFVALLQFARLRY
ncbi:hypothetical protein SFRURICE_016996 [Spodoptera frugiperda]|nr:hypothetical protein SFRURICE_016996 [Spodoptera frugiperda]